VHLQFSTAQLVILGYSEKIMKSKALMAYSMKILGWWDVMPHGLVNTNISQEPAVPIFRADRTLLLQTVCIFVRSQLPHTKDMDSLTVQ
jgi:hypothetical protein